MTHLHAISHLIHINFVSELMLLGLQTVRNFAFGPVRIRSYYPQVTSQVDQYRNGMDIYGPYTDRDQENFHPR